MYLIGSALPANSCACPIHVAFCPFVVDSWGASVSIHVGLLNTAVRSHPPCFPWSCVCSRMNKLCLSISTHTMSSGSLSFLDNNQTGLTPSGWPLSWWPKPDVISQVPNKSEWSVPLTHFWNKGDALGYHCYWYCRNWSQLSVPVTCINDGLRPALTVGSSHWSGEKIINGSKRIQWLSDAVCGLLLFTVACQDEGWGFPRQLGVSSCQRHFLVCFGDGPNDHSHWLQGLLPGWLSRVTWILGIAATVMHGDF